MVGIGGSAIALSPGCCGEHGFRDGSDSGVYPPASTLLEKLGIFFSDFYGALSRGDQWLLKTL